MTRPLPFGLSPTAMMIGGTLVAGLAAYAWQAIVTRALDADDLVAVITCWIVAYLVSAAVIMPIEQLVTRSEVAGTQTPVRSIAVFAVSWTVVVLVAAALGASRFLASDPALVIVAAAIVPLFALLAVVRGRAAGSGRYARYGLITAVDASVRAALCALVVVAGGSRVAIAATIPLAALTAALFLGRPPRRADAPDARSRHFLFASSSGAVCANLLLVAPPLVAGVIGATSAEVAALGVAMTAFRAPLFLVIPLVARTLRPLLLRVARDGPAAITPIANRTLLLGAALAFAVGATAAVVGPAALQLAFGSAADIDATAAALVGAGTTLAAVNLVLAQTLVAANRASYLPRVWIVALVGAALVAVLVPGSATIRTLLAFNAGELLAATLVVVVAHGRGSRGAAVLNRQA